MCGFGVEMLIWTVGKGFEIVSHTHCYKCYYIYVGGGLNYAIWMIA